MKASEALNYVAGYACANDVSARRWQGKKGGGQWYRCKSFDTFGPLGPFLVCARGPVPSICGKTLNPNLHYLKFRAFGGGHADALRVEHRHSMLRGATLTSRMCAYSHPTTHAPTRPKPQVSTAVVPDPNRLAIRTTVNGEVRQDSNTNQMIFSVPQIIEFCSQGTTLAPGERVWVGRELEKSLLERLASVA